MIRCSGLQKSPSLVIHQSTLLFSSPASFPLILFSAFLLSLLFFTFLSHSIAPVNWLPVRQCDPRGSNQLNYWEHKNAAANGSWINTLAKLLPWHPLLPRGIKLKILRLRMQWLGAPHAALFAAEPQPWDASKLLGSCKQIS